MASDDSDFYGDEDTVAELQARVDDFDLAGWMRQQQENPGRALRQKNLVADVSKLHNPYAGVPYAWQLTETVDGFLRRLPPRTTPITFDTPWIFICNPYISRVEKAEAENQSIKGNEDEAPEEFGSRTSLVVEGGTERLELVTKFIEGMRKSPKTPSAQEREIQKERKSAADDILDLAHAAKVRAGKWMLFCPPAEVNEVWEIVAKATANNELGIAAKVAPKPEDEDPRRERLICVYTTDFRDAADVGRVLQKLRELRLVEARGRPIYYKPDAYTYIGISHGNIWGLKASIYSSRYVFQD
ncbi:Fc.00g012700.m01.CDS01 [Cosmosporella sp. VM-42]